MSRVERVTVCSGTDSTAIANITKRGQRDAEASFRNSSKTGWCQVGELPGISASIERSTSFVSMLCRASSKQYQGGDFRLPPSSARVENFRKSLGMCADQQR